jgi:hypothetical protein
MRFALPPAAFATTARWLMRCFRQKRANAAHLNKRQLLVSLDRELGLHEAAAAACKNLFVNILMRIFRLTLSETLPHFANICATCLLGGL